MAQSSGGGLERLLEDLVRRAVENGLASFEQTMRKEIQQAVAKAGLSAAASGVVGGTRAAAEAPYASAAPTPSVLPAVNQAVARVLQPTGQSEIMAAALQTAAGFAGRCALFVKKGDSFSIWRTEGFPAEATSQLKSLSVSASQSGVFREITESQLGVSSLRTAEALPQAMIEALAGAAEESLYLFPVVVQGRIVAALYADSGSAAGSVEPAAVEILARVAGLSLETAAGRAAASAARPVVAPAEASASALPAVAEAPVEASPPPSAPVIPAIPPPPDPETLPEHDRDIHKKAYRSARVAVQDLLAYPQNQARIEEGRKNNTLYRLLKEEIDKNRETYQKRFGQTAARSFDYLHYELVIKLAENDPETLGGDYPGAVAG